MRIAPPARSGRAMLAPTMLFRTRVQNRILPLSPVGHRCVADERCSPLRVRDLITPCHLENGDISNIAAVYNRDGAKSITANAAGRTSVRSGRAMLAPTIKRRSKIHCRRGGHWPSACENSQRCETARECKIELFHYHRSGWRNNDTFRSK